MNTDRMGPKLGQSPSQDVDHEARRRRSDALRRRGGGDRLRAMSDDPPCFEVARVEALARELLGHPVTASALPSERDQNFLLTVAGGPPPGLKIARPGEGPALPPA